MTSPSVLSPSSSIVQSDKVPNFTIISQPIGAANPDQPTYSEPPKIMSVEERKRVRPTFTARNWGSGAGSKVATSYKTILLGDNNVGKTSIFVRLTQEIF